MKKLINGAIISGIVLVSGCATILNDDSQNINVRTSNNSKITAHVNGQQITTPSAVRVLRAKDDLIIQTNHAKCAPQTAAKSSVDNVFFVNILSGGVTGSTTDYASGDMWEYDSDIVISCNN